MANEAAAATPSWYVVHTYSGYENKVKDNLEKSVENNGLQDLIFEVRVPVEEVVELKNDKKRTIQRKIFPGYVMVRMIITDQSWYVVRNTRGVTGFVGPGSKPIALTDEEVMRMCDVAQPDQPGVAIGATVRIADGPLAGFSGVIEEMDAVRQKLRVAVSMFGRETSVELDFNQIEAE